MGDAGIEPTNTNILSNDQEEQLAAKLSRIFREEFYTLQPRYLLLNLITSLIPRYVGGRIRTRILQAAGLRIGYGTVIMGTPHLYGPGDIRSRLQIGSYGMLNIGCTFDLNAPIMIGNHVSIGHEVLILTSSHEIGYTIHRAGPLLTAPVMIKDGAWIGARSVILPGVTVGAGSVVGAGAIVTKDVPPNTLAGGVPARVIRSIDR